MRVGIVTVLLHLLLEMSFWHVCIWRPVCNQPSGVWPGDAAARVSVRWLWPSVKRWGWAAAGSQEHAVIFRWICAGATVTYVNTYIIYTMLVLINPFLELFCNMTPSKAVYMLARWKTGPTAVFPSWGLRARGPRLSVHLWCLCWISEAREMFQRSERIPVSVERPKREHVSKRAAPWAEEREREGEGDRSQLRASERKSQLSGGWSPAAGFSVATRCCLGMQPEDGFL